MHFKISKKAQLKNNNAPHADENAAAKLAATAGERFLERQKLRLEREKFMKQVSIEAERTSGNFGIDSSVKSSATEPKAKVAETDINLARETAKKAYALLREKRILNSDSARKKVGGSKSNVKDF